MGRVGAELTPAGQASSTIKLTCSLLVQRLDALRGRIESGDEAAWDAFLETAAVFAALLPNIAPGAHGELLTTAQMAARLGVSPKTLLRRKAKGEIRPALTRGTRGRAAVRWRADQLPNANGDGNASRK